MGRDVFVCGNNVLNGAFVADAAGGPLGEALGCAAGRDGCSCCGRGQGRVAEDRVERAIADVGEICVWFGDCEWYGIPACLCPGTGGRSSLCYSGRSH